MVGPGAAQRARGHLRARPRVQPGLHADPRGDPRRPPRRGPLRLTAVPGSSDRPLSHPLGTLGRWDIRGKVVEQERARELRAAGVDAAGDRHRARRGRSRRCRSGCATSSSSPSPRSSSRRPSRGRTPSSGARRPRSPSCSRRAVAASAALSEQEFLVAGTALYAGEGAKTDGAVMLRQQRSSDDRLLLRLAPALLRRSTSRGCASAALPPRGSRPRGGDRVLGPSSPGIPRDAVHQALPGGRRSVASAGSKHPMGCPAVGYSCTRTHRARDGPRARAARVRRRPSGVAQLAERSPVNPIVVGSSPTPGAQTPQPNPAGASSRPAPGARLPSLAPRGGSSVVRARDS